MDRSDHAELAALVAAWHNRHPLARRITPAQVRGEGLVVLPYLSEDPPIQPPAASELAPASASPDNAGSPPTDGAESAATPTAPTGGRLGRLLAWWQGLRQRPKRTPRARRRPRLRAAFDEDFMAPLRPARIARHGLRQGSTTRPGPPDWPERQVMAKAGSDASQLEQRYLRTAAIEVGKQRRRVLIGVGRRAEVIGPRLWSRPRCGIAAALLASVLLGAGWWGGLVPGAHSEVIAASGPAASASGVLQQPAAAPASGAASAAVLVQAAIPASAPTSAPTSAAHPGTVAPAVAVAASSPASSTDATASLAPAGDAASASPSRGIRPDLSPEARLAARQESQALRSAQAASGAASGAAAADGQVYAVATPETRTRAAAQLRIVLMNVPTEAEPGRPRAEIMQVGQGWRAVIWPYDNRAEAELTREQLASRGIPAEVIGF